MENTTRIPMIVLVIIVIALLLWYGLADTPSIEEASPTPVPTATSTELGIDLETTVLP